jgi:hypothetical protein
MTMKKRLFILFAAAVLFAVGACDKKEDTTLSKKPVEKGPIIETPSSTEGLTIVDPETGVTIVVPAEVKEKWVYVIIEVNDKQEDKKEEFTVFIGGKFTIPDSDLTVNVGPFLPDFQLNEQTITSRSVDPNNPSVGISVEQGSEQIFPSTGKWGWLHANFPQIHSFQHERYTLTLKAARFKDEEGEEAQEGIKNDGHGLK